MAKPKQVAIYVRVSTDDQMKKGYSIESQIDECKKRAFEFGYTEDDILVISDGVSGGEIDRPGLNKLREWIDSPSKPEIIIMFDPDRFARKLSTQLVISEDIQKAEIKLEFIKFKLEDTPEGKMFYGMRGLFAEFEREKIRERTIRGRMTKIKKHGKLSGDPRLYGYQFDTKEDVLIVDPKESHVVRFMFELAAAGHSGEKIAEILASDHIPAPRGDKWYGSTVTRILNNESYLGTYWAYKSDYHKGKKRNRPREEQFPIPIDPLVDQETFDQVKKNLRKNSTRTGRPAKRHYLISGIGRCYCGKSVVASVKSGNREYTYYSCVGKHKKVFDSDTGKGKIQCNSSYWNSSVVDDVVWNEVEKIIEHPDLFIDEYIKFKNQNSQNKSDSTIETTILLEKQKTLKHKNEKLLDLYLSDGIDREAYSKKTEELEEQLADIEKRLNELDSEQKTNQLSEQVMMDQLSVLKKYQDGLKRLTFKQKKDIANLLIDRVEFGQNRELAVVFTISEHNWKKSNHGETYGR